MEKLIIRETPLLYHVRCEEYANLDNPIDIWIKFTNYLKPDETALLEKLGNKSLDSIQISEINEYSRIKNQLMISELFLKYKNKNCSKEEYDIVTRFMDSMSLQTLIKTKLTEDEIELASKAISKLKTIEQLEEYIELQQKKFEELNAYESYIFLLAKEKLHNLNQDKVMEQIKIEQARRANNLIKGLIRDYDHNF